MAALFFFITCFFPAAWGEVSEKTLEPITVRAKRESETSAPEISEHVETVDPVRQTHLLDVLEEQPSISIRKAGGQSGPTWVSIRGQSPSETRWFLESIPLTESEYQQTPFSILSTDFFEKVSVYPAAPPLSLLSDGIGGAVQLEIGEPRREWTGLLRGGAFRYLKASTKASTGKHSLGLDFTRSDENFTYFDSNGTPYNTSDDLTKDRDHNGFWRATIFPRVQAYESGHSRGRFFALLSTGATELPGSIDRPQESRLTDVYGLAGFTDERTWAESSLATTAYGRYYSEKLSGELPLSGRVPTKTVSWAGGLRSTYRFPLSSSLNGELAAGPAWERFSPTVEGLTGDPIHRKLAVPFGASAHWKMGAGYSLRPAVLASMVQLSADHDPRFSALPFRDSLKDREFFVVSPRVGADWEGKMLGVSSRVLLSVGRYQRAPSLMEVYGSTWGISPALEVKSESAWKGEIEAQWKGETWRGGYAFHVSRAEDLITFAAVSPQSRGAMNVGQALIYGHEARLELRARSGLFAKSWVSLLESRNLTDSVTQKNRELPGRASEFRLSAGYETETARAAYSVEWRGPHFLDLSNGTKVDSSIEHSVSAMKKTKYWGIFSIDVRNIFDGRTVQGLIGEAPVTELASGLGGYPSPGRSFYLTWRYTL